MDKETFNKIKNSKTEYFEYVTFSDRDVKKTLKVFNHFKNYILCAYNTLFIETELGVRNITCINGDGIRVEYFESREDEWISIKNIGNLDATKRKLVKQ